MTHGSGDIAVRCTLIAVKSVVNCGVLLFCSSPLAPDCQGVFYGNMEELRPGTDSVVICPGAEQ